MRLPWNFADIFVYIRFFLYLCALKNAKVTFVHGELTNINMEYIKDFIFHKMWDKYDVQWHNIQPDVNVLVGINGKGKTTLLDAIDSYYHQKFPITFFKKYGIDRIEATHLDSPLYYIQSADIPAVVKKRGNSVLYDRLMRVVVQNEYQNSFFNYRMRALNYPEEAARVKMRIQALFDTIDSFFSQTNKHVAIDAENNMLVFRNVVTDNETITLGMLSAGEKQLLLILLTVFLMDDTPAVLLMDEPELSLHIEWQEKLIAAIRNLNKNCQLIITTHSPSIFACGWEDKLVFMEDLYAHE